MTSTQAGYSSMYKNLNKIALLIPFLFLALTSVIFAQSPSRDDFNIFRPTDPFNLGNQVAKYPTPWVFFAKEEMFVRMISAGEKERVYCSDTTHYFKDNVEASSSNTFPESMWRWDGSNRFFRYIERNRIEIYERKINNGGIPTHWIKVIEPADTNSFPSEWYTDTQSNLQWRYVAQFYIETRPIPVSVSPRITSSAPICVGGS